MPNNVSKIDTPKAEFRELAEFGFSVIPIPRGKKQPAFKWAQHQKTKATSAQIERWDASNLNVGVVTGKLSNVVVLDVDSEEAQKLVDELQLPLTPTVQTARGRHYYFRVPQVEIRNKTKINGVELDVRGEGGMAVGAGSLHPEGGFYRWDVSPSDVEIAEMPENLLALLKQEKATSSRQVATKAAAPFVEAGLLSTYLNMQLQTALTSVRECGEGGRNDRLFKEAAHIANHVAAIGLDWSQIADMFEAAGLAAGLDPAECASTVSSAWNTGRKTPTQWLQVAANWIFVGSRDRFWSPSIREDLTASSFSMMFADAMPSVDGERVKGRMANFLTHGGIIERVIDFRYDPAKPTGVVEVRGEKFYNRYRSPDIVACDGDSRPLTEFLAYLVPAAHERAHLEKMIAWTVRNPGKKLRHALLLQSKSQGIGKTTLADIWRALLGFENTRKTNSEEMSSNYQSYMADSLLIVLEELSLGSGMTVYNKLKDLISGDTAIVNEKYMKQKEVPNLANFVFLSNLDAPLLIERADRRFFVIDSPAEKRDPEFWSQFYAWWKSNLGVVRGYFDSVDLSDFQPDAPPPETEAKERLKRHSETPFVQELRTLIEDHCYPFNGDVFTIDEVQAALKHRGLRRETFSKLVVALKEIGCVPLKQIRLGGNARPSVWACRNIEQWSEAMPDEMRGEYFRKSNTTFANDNHSSMKGEAS